MSIGKTQSYAFNFRKMEYRKGHSHVLGYIRELMQRRFWDAAATERIIKLILARFYADESTVESSFYHLKPNYADQKGVESPKNGNF